MKKILMVFLIISLVFSTAACGGGGQTDSGENPPESSSPDSATSGDEGGSSLGDDMKDILDEGASGTIESGNTTVEFAGDWPDYELFKGLPGPAGGTIAATEEVAGELANVMLVDMSIDECRQYAAQLAALGYDQNVYETEMEGVYSYEADNGEGLHLSCGYFSETVVVQISVNE